MSRCITQQQKPAAVAAPLVCCRQIYVGNLSSSVDACIMFKVCAAIVSLRLSPVHAAEASFMFTHVQRDLQTRLSWLCPAPRWAVMGRATDGHYKLVSIRCIKRDSAPSGLNQNAENKEQIDSECLSCATERKSSIRSGWDLLYLLCSERAEGPWCRVLVGWCT